MKVWTLAVAGAIAIASAIAPSAVIASDYPNKSIRLIVPYPAGGASDVVARLFAALLTKKLGQQVFVENKPGANGQIGSEIVAHAKPDGYTLLSTVTSSHAVAPALERKLPYDPIKSFAPIIKIGDSRSFAPRSTSAGPKTSPSCSCRC